MPRSLLITSLILAASILSFPVHADVKTDVDKLVKEAVNSDQKDVPKAPALAQMSTAEREAFEVLLTAVKSGDSNAIVKLSMAKSFGEGPLAIIDFHTLLRRLAEDLIALRFPKQCITTVKLCEGKLEPRNDPSFANEQQGRSLRERWWSLSADYVKPLVCLQRRPPCGTTAKKG